MLIDSEWVVIVTCILLLTMGQCLVKIRVGMGG